MPDNPPLSPSAKPIFEAFISSGVPEELAYTATERVQELAGHTIVTALRAEIAGLRWMFGVILALLAILVTLVGIVIVQGLADRNAPDPPPVVYQLPATVAPPASEVPSGPSEQ